METENTPSHEESIAIIAAMIGSARKSFQDSSFYFLLWGWLVFIASISEYLLIEWLHFDKHYYVWFLMPIGGIISAIYGRRQSKREQVKSYIDGYIDQVWIAFVIVMIIVLCNMPYMGYSIAYGFLIALYGIGTFITGSILGFRPLKWGGIACWIISAVTYHVNSSDILLLLALAITLGYIIPGHLLKMQNTLQHV